MNTDPELEPHRKLRMVAIVGRPNVGKSALFNRLAGGRIAIVHEEPGVTRDRLVRDVTWNGQHLQLADTGGISNVDGETRLDAISAGIHKQVEAALADARAVLMVVDVEAGLTPMDEAVARWLRKAGCQAIVAANKADNPSRDNRSVDFASLGFPVFPVSALHNRGVDELIAALLAACPAEEGDPVVLGIDAAPLRVAVVGRPNVGKSSYINRLLGDERVIVSDVPGTTRDCIDVPFTIGSGPTARRYLLVDTAGVRRVGKIDTIVERFSRMRTEAAIERANVVVLVLDAESGPTQQDKKIAGLIEEHHRGAIVIVNKWDLATATQTKYDPALREALPFLSHSPVVYLSAQTGYNIRKSIEAIDHVAAQVHARLPTGILNRALIDAFERVRPPSVRGHQLKIFYATQVGGDPLRIRIFVNLAESVAPAYRAYLIKAIREKFGLEGAPIILQFATRRRNP